ncbi:apolipoprotein N-acyltransferase [Spongisporangium articulatum]|uniref:Apolipoprotein N-acyltransferase n=1 Tax=Spongisporangium articulatum TaxID=3362603 RepID=A0ABW8ARV2_9ACTN
MGADGTRLWLGRLALSVASGALLAAAFPSLGWWPLAPVAVAGLTLATKDARARTAALCGLLFGLAFFVPHVKWSGVYVGKLPWFALATVEALYLVPMAALFPLAWRLGATLRTRAPLLCLSTGGLWVLQESLRGSVPFGGFPWGRLAASQAYSPYAPLAALGGMPLVTWAVAATGALLALAVVDVARAQNSSLGARLVPAAGLVVLGAALGAAGYLVPLPTSGQPTATDADGTVNVAAIQGNVPEAGLEFNAERRAVLDNHAKTTAHLAEEVAQGKAARPDIVLWPENSSDIDPYRNPDAAAVIHDAVTEIGVPTLVGAVLQNDDGTLSNAGIVWTSSGPGASYLKQHPVPFGEYIPYRSFFRHFSDKVDLVRADFVAGKKSGVLQLGPARIGDVICFEVAYDGLVRDTVAQGAQLLVVQTNNATFGYTDESVQQLAMSKLRAIESGRAVVHVSTVGVSAIIEPDGRIVQRSGHFTRSVLQAQVPLRHSQTLATRLGALPEVLFAGVALLLLAGAWRTGRTGASAGSAVGSAAPERDGEGRVGARTAGV